MARQRLCSIPGCGRKHFGKGFCQRHYQAEYMKRPGVRERRLEIYRKYHQSPRGQEKNREHARGYRARNPDAWVKWRSEHPEALKTSRLKSKPKKAEYHRHYAARPEVHARRLAQSRAYRKTPKGLESARYYNERRRARKLKVKGSFTKEEWLKVRDATDGVCSYCGKYVGVEKLTLDHIVPLSKGGTNYITNIRAICKRCNSRRGNRGYIWEINPATGRYEKWEG